jgi:hypothetical protein
MSAEIVSLQAWRRRHSEHREPESHSVSFPCLLPTWPYGWLQPVLVDVGVKMIAGFGMFAACIAGQANLGGSACHDLSPRPAQARRESAAVIDFSGRRLPRPPMTYEAGRKRIW